MLTLCCTCSTSVLDFLLVCALFKSFNARTECILVKKIVRGHNNIEKMYLERERIHGVNTLLIRFLQINLNLTGSMVMYTQTKNR